VVENTLTSSSLTGSGVETWNENLQGGRFVCFRNARGELFHFKRNLLMRGKPRGPFNTIEEHTRPATMLTLENAANVSGCFSAASLGGYIRKGQLKAIKKVWRYGRIQRSGLLIDISDLEQFLAKRAIERHKGKLIEWDIDPLRLIREVAKS